jgi:hypothetical protein
MWVLPFALRKRKRKKKAFKEPIGGTTKRERSWICFERGYIWKKHRWTWVAMCGDSSNCLDTRGGLCSIHWLEGSDLVLCSYLKEASAVYDYVGLTIRSSTLPR